MTKKNFYHGAWKLRVTAALVLALALSTFPAAFSRVQAQSPAKPTTQTPTKATASPAGESKGGQKEGIKVHGHWTIDVRNPDGTLVTHQEFENALVPTGGLILSRFLGRQATVGEWEIHLQADSGNGPPCTYDGIQEHSNFCLILEPTTAYFNAPHIFKTLKLSLPTSGTNANALVLAGTATATRDGEVQSVSTYLMTCPATTPASNCTGALTLGPSITSKGGLSTPVSNGQIIQVTVVISFS